MKLLVPSTFCVAGPSGVGKTSWVCNLIKHREDVFVDSPTKIYWCYSHYQPAYEELSRDIPSVQFLEGIPADFSDLIDSRNRNLVILDDLMSECGQNPEVTKLFTRGSHHQNVTVVYIVQNLFHQSKESRTTISPNCHYLVLFKNPRDRSQIMHLARQMYPGQSKFMIEAF